MSTMFRINVKDILRGLVTAVLGAALVAVVSVLNSIFTAPNFDVFAVNWQALGQNILNVGLNAATIAFWGYLAKNFLSNSDGNFLGKI